MRLKDRLHTELKELFKINNSNKSWQISMLTALSVGIPLLISSFGFLFSYAVGQIFSFNSIVAVIAFGLFAMVIHWVILYYKTAPPRSFFFIFIVALSISQPYNFNTISSKVGLLSLGLLFSCFLTLGYLIYLSTKMNIEDQPAPERVIRKIYTETISSTYLTRKEVYTLCRL